MEGTRDHSLSIKVPLFGHNHVRTSDFYLGHKSRLMLSTVFRETGKTDKLLEVKKQYVQLRICKRYRLRYHVNALDA